jgi:hypothetical protein
MLLRVSQETFTKKLDFSQGTLTKTLLQEIKQPCKKRVESKISSMATKPLQSLAHGSSTVCQAGLGLMFRFVVSYAAERQGYHKTRTLLGRSDVSSTS